jgi:Subtilase family
MAVPGQHAQLPHSAAELVVVVKQGSPLHTSFVGGTPTAPSPDVSSLQSILAKAGAAMHPLFAVGEGPSALGSAVLATPERPAEDLSRFFHVAAPESQLETLATELREHPSVESAYVKPPAEPPVAALAMTRTLGTLVAARAPAPLPGGGSLDYTANQSYLDPAPVGIDARYIWTVPGGGGAGVQIIDCEWSWNFSHEDLLHNKRGVVVGTPGGDDDHGTSVMGEIGGDLNSFGITGIASEATFGAASFANNPTAQVIMSAANLLRAGDIMLLEIHRPGPNANGQGQFGYIAVEWWPDDFAAIRYAINRGIIVVEAAGNGSQNLDDPIYSNRPAGFPPTWTNPFNPANPSSEAVLVGAGNPPKGTHGRDVQPGWNEPYYDRARCGFSNYGQRLDCQGWGWEVTSTGYGDLVPGTAQRDRWYTNEFSGTSSASPIITGTLACLQGVLKARGGSLLTPSRAIQLLRSTGSPQQNAPNRPTTQRIGNRPDLRQLASVGV